MNNHKITYWPTPFVLVLCSVVAFAQLPDPQLTPGVIRTSNGSEVCAASFRTKPFRHTTQAMKKQVCAAYHIAKCPAKNTLEIDHLIPLELGGLDDVRNLWPQLAKYPNGPGFHVKDKLENELHRRVCQGNMSLPEAQACIRSNWIECYQKLFGSTPQ